MNPYDMPECPRHDIDKWQRCSKCDKEFIDEDLHAHNNTIVCESCLTKIENAMPNERLNEITSLLLCNDLTPEEVQLLVLEAYELGSNDRFNELSKLL